MKVLVVNRFTSEALKKLELSCSKVVHADDISLAEEHFADTEILLIRSRTQVTKNLLTPMPKLKLIITSTSGFDHIDLDLCQEKGIKVCHTPKANAGAAAELTWALIFASLRKLPEAFAETQKHHWTRSHLLGEELSGKSLSIIGFGNVGKRVGQVAKALGLKVFVHDPYVTQEAGYEFLGLEEAIKCGDIVSLHLPLTSRTKNMINYKTLPWFNTDCLLVNTSRGEVVFEEDLAKHIKETPGFRAAIDVFRTEPLIPEHIFQSCPEILKTPHIGATTKQALFASCNEAAEKAIAYVSSNIISDSLPPKALWWQDR